MNRNNEMCYVCAMFVLCLFAEYYWDEETEGFVMSRTCSSQEGDVKLAENASLRFEPRSPLATGVGQ